MRNRDGLRQTETFASLFSEFVGVSPATEPTDAQLAGIGDVISRIAHVAPAAQLTAEMKAVYSENPWTFLHGLRVMGAVATCSALRTGRVDLLSDLLFIATSDLMDAYATGLPELVSGTVGHLSDVDCAARVLAGLESRGAYPMGLQYAARWFDELGATSAVGQGWLFIETERGPWMSYDPVMALAPEMAKSPDAGDRASVTALDVDVFRVRVDLLPIPCGRDLRIERYFRTINGPDRFLATVSEMNEIRERASMLFAGRWAERAVREKNASILAVALLAASVPAVPSGGEDPAAVAVSSVLVGASELGVQLQELVDEVRPIVDHSRYWRAERIAAQPGRLPDIGGLDIRQGPDGFTILGRRY